MAKGIKVHMDSINDICKQIDSLLSELDEILKRMDSNAALINDSWQSNAAIKYLDNINTQKKKLSEARQAIDNKKKYIIQSANNIVNIDKTIKSSLSKYTL